MEGVEVWVGWLAVLWLVMRYPVPAPDREPEVG